MKATPNRTGSNSAAPLVQIGGRLVDPTDFFAGRDLAVRLFRQVESIDPTNCADMNIEAVYRSGPEQANVSREFLSELVEHPELLDGFAAVLSDACFNMISGLTGGRATSRLYADLTLLDVVGGGEAPAGVANDGEGQCHG